MVVIIVLWNRCWKNFSVLHDKHFLGFLVRNLDDCVLVIVVVMLMQMFVRREGWRSGKGRNFRPSRWTR